MMIFLRNDEARIGCFTFHVSHPNIEMCVYLNYGQDSGKYELSAMDRSFSI
jgi:hypothetical protein